MSLKTVFIINAIIAGFFASVSLLLPTTMLSWYGVVSTDALVLMTRFFGVTLLTIALATFNLKNAEFKSEVKSFVFALLISNAVGVIVAIWGQFANIVNNLGWSIIIIYVFLTIAYYSIYSKK
jgi:hypothetical protein